MKVAFYVGASSKNGYGHAVRCVALAKELCQQGASQIRFFFRGDKAAAAWVSKLGVDLELVDRPQEEVIDQIRPFSPRAVVWDLPGGASSAAIDRARAHGMHSVLIDDMGPARLKADLCFVPTRASESPALWEGSRGSHFSGPDYAMVRSAIAAVNSNSRKDAYRVLVTMGGSDPCGITIKAIDALERVQHSLLVDLVIGAGFQHYQTLLARLSAVEGMYFCHFAVRDMASLMARADLAVAAYGSLVYELAAAGLPGLILSRTAEDAQEAENFASLGSAIALGQFEQVNDELLAGTLDALRRDCARRRNMSAAGKRAVDGLGAARVASRILQLMAEPAVTRKSWSGLEPAQREGAMTALLARGAR